LRQWSLLGKMLAQRGALQQFHSQDHHLLSTFAAMAEYVENPADVAMSNSAGDESLAAQSLLGGGVANPFQMERLDRYLHTKLAIMGAEHFSHSARADEGLDFESRAH